MINELKILIKKDRVYLGILFALLSAGFIWHIAESSRSGIEYNIFLYYISELNYNGFRLGNWKLLLIGIIYIKIALYDNSSQRVIGDMMPVRKKTKVIYDLLLGFIIYGIVGIPFVVRYFYDMNKLAQNSDISYNSIAGYIAHATEFPIQIMVALLVYVLTIFFKNISNHVWAVAIGTFMFTKWYLIIGSYIESSFGYGQEYERIYKLIYTTIGGDKYYHSLWVNSLHYAEFYCGWILFGIVLFSVLSFVAVKYVRLEKPVVYEIEIVRILICIMVGMSVYDMSPATNEYFDSIYPMSLYHFDLDLLYRADRFEGITMMAIGISLVLIGITSINMEFNIFKRNE